MELIASGGADLSATARRSRADVVIVAEEVYEGDPAHRQVLVDNPQLKLFVVTDDGRAAHMLEFRRLPGADVSPQGLVGASRRAGARAAKITIKDRTPPGATTLVIGTASPGEWGNQLDVVVGDSLVDRSNLFTLSVYRDRSAQTPPLPPLLLETHENLSMLSTS